jgi:putative endonuclease
MANLKGEIKKSITTKQTGDLGEKIAVNYLKKQGLTVLDTNYRKNWGELDIVAKNIDRIHFVEVKTLSYETKKKLESSISNKGWRPEEQVHQRKIHQISKAIDSWLLENRWEGDWQIDVIAIRLVHADKYATIKYIDNVILD